MGAVVKPRRGAGVGRRRALALGEAAGLGGPLGELGCGDPIVRAKQEWETTADSLPQLICVVDEDGRVSRANRTVERWGLASVTNVRGMTLDELLHGRCADASCRLRAFMREAMHSARRGRCSRCQVVDGRLKRPLEIVVLPNLATPHGRTRNRYAVVVIDDIAGLTGTEAALRQSESELRLLSAQLLSAQEMERKRIASDLHDSVGASLSALKLSLEQAIESMPPGESAACRVPLQVLVQKMRETVGEVRRIAMDLRPATLDDLGLIATLSWFFREFAAIHPGIRVTKEVDLHENDIPAALKIILFRIIQEGVNNIVKHAAADEIHFGLKRSGREIELILEDRGRGFDPTQVLLVGAGDERGLGIGSMRERTELSGGIFSLESSPGAGTRLRAAWPLGCAAAP